MGDLSIYVDTLVPVARNARWRWDHACHLFTTDFDLTALDAFALSIGMRREWRHDAIGFPHYDLHRRHRALAVKAGAIEVTRDHPAMRTMLDRRRVALSLIPRYRASP